MPRQPSSSRTEQLTQPRDRCAAIVPFWCRAPGPKPAPATERFYLGELFTLERPSGADAQAIVHVVALGREIVRKTILPGTLREPPAEGLPALLPDLPALALGRVRITGRAPDRLVFELAGECWKSGDVRMP